MRQSAQRPPCDQPVWKLPSSCIHRLQRIACTEERGSASQHAKEARSAVKVTGHIHGHRRIWPDMLPVTRSAKALTVPRQLQMPEAAINLARCSRLPAPGVQAQVIAALQLNSR